MTRSVALIILWLITSTAFSDDRQADAESFFESKIRPILAGTCLSCHGGKKVSNGLRVNSRESLLKGGESGPALVVGDPEKSLIMRAIRRTDEGLQMPPDKPLPKEVVADFALWIKNGATWPAKVTISPAAAVGHWAFQPVKKVTPPADSTRWSDHPIDRFIAAKWRRHGLKPVASADRRTLLRRVYFDLIGLPPSPEELTTFVSDSTPDAFNKVIERLLASPHYGERWGRHWMDVARYADTAGDNADYPVPEIRLYRDYIIDAFNADKPYDEFVREQVAGDILAKSGPKEKYAERVTATGFLALSRRYATAPYELWHLTLEDTIDTVGRAFLGLTMKCARCHDHKFDPITKEDYYALYGVFASTQFPWAGAEEFASKQFPREHFVPLVPPSEAAPKLASYQKAVQDLSAAIERQKKEEPLAREAEELNRLVEAKSKELKALEAEKKPADAARKELEHLKKKQKDLKTQRDRRKEDLNVQLRRLRNPGLPADLPGAYAVQEGKPADAHIHVRGEPEQQGPKVKRNVPAFLAGGTSFQIPEGSSGRLQLAEWLTRPQNALTARVMVNRIWQHHFGKGIVRTPSNFGVRGEPPTHPELLDWLANQFVEKGWSIKALHRLILSSKTYQLASSFDEANSAKDPGNQWYWRFDRRRLDAEAIRDAILMASGKLDRRPPGPHPFPTMEKWGWTQHNPFKDVYPSNHRSVYLMTQRLQRHPYLAIFDGPDTNTTTEERASSTVPQQALYMMNNPFVHEQAEAFARRLLESSGGPHDRIVRAHLLAWCRPPTSEEMELGKRYLQNYAQAFGDPAASSDRRDLAAWTSYAKVLLSANEFVYVD